MLAEYYNNPCTASVNRLMYSKPFVPHTTRFVYGSNDGVNRIVAMALNQNNSIMASLSDEFLVEFTSMTTGEILEAKSIPEDIFAHFQLERPSIDKCTVSLGYFFDDKMLFCRINSFLFLFCFHEETTSLSQVLLLPFTNSPVDILSYKIDVNVSNIFLLSTITLIHNTTDTLQKDDAYHHSYSYSLRNQDIHAAVVCKGRSQVEYCLDVFIHTTATPLFSYSLFQKDGFFISDIFVRAIKDYTHESLTAHSDQTVACESPSPASVSLNRMSFSGELPEDGTPRITQSRHQGNAQKPSPLPSDINEYTILTKELLYRASNDFLLAVCISYTSHNDGSSCLLDTTASAESNKLIRAANKSSGEDKSARVKEEAFQKVSIAAEDGRIDPIRSMITLSMLTKEGHLLTSYFVSNDTHSSIRCMEEDLRAPKRLIHSVEHVAYHESRGDTPLLENAYEISYQRAGNYYYKYMGALKIQLNGSVIVLQLLRKPIHPLPYIASEDINKNPGNGKKVSLILSNISFQQSSFSLTLPCLSCYHPFLQIRSLLYAFSFVDIELKKLSLGCKHLREKRFGTVDYISSKAKCETFTTWTLNNGTANPKIEEPLFEKEEKKKKNSHPIKNDSLPSDLKHNNLVKSIEDCEMENTRGADSVPTNYSELPIYEFRESFTYQQHEILSTVIVDDGVSPHYILCVSERDVGSAGGYGIRCFSLPFLFEDEKEKVNNGEMGPESANEASGGAIDQCANTHVNKELSFLRTSAVISEEERSSSPENINSMTSDYAFEMLYNSARGRLLCAMKGSGYVFSIGDIRKDRWEGYLGYGFERLARCQWKTNGDSYNSYDDIASYEYPLYTFKAPGKGFHSNLPDMDYRVSQFADITALHGSHEYGMENSFSMAMRLVAESEKIDSRAMESAREDYMLLKSLENPYSVMGEAVILKKMNRIFKRKSESEQLYDEVKKFLYVKCHCTMETLNTLLHHHVTEIPEGNLREFWRQKYGKLAAMDDSKMGRAKKKVFILMEQQAIPLINPVHGNIIVTELC